MAGFTKLQSSIVHSTIWREPNHVRIVWITMLAICDKNGLVEASLPGLADLSRVSLDECKDAIGILSSADEYSRSQEYEGRRIDDTDGGWLILNYAKYRGEFTADKIKRQNRERQRKFRDKSNESNDNSVTVTLHNVNNAQSESESESESEADKNKSKRCAKSHITYTGDFETFWQAYPRKGRVAKKKAFDSWKAVERYRPDIGTLLATIKNQSHGEKWRGGYIPNATTWLNQHRWEDETTSAAPTDEIIPGVSMREQQEFERRQRQK
ncbi:MAG: hypothetical protein GY847_28740 [Proteobacteria bacterium]|nr:hypothetical protein [Pseudomonadota bacterium]